MASRVKSSFSSPFKISLLVTFISLASAFKSLDPPSEMTEELFSSETIWLIDEPLFTHSNFRNLKNYFEGKDLSSLLNQKESLEVDCSELEKLLPNHEKSILFNIDLDQDEKIKIQICETQKVGKILKVVSFSRTFIDFELKENFLQSFFGLSEKNNKKITEKEETIRLCKAGFFSFIQKSCKTHKRKLTISQDQELLYIYGNFSQFYDVPSAVTFSAGVNMTHDFFVYLTSELRKYTFGTLNTSRNVFTVSDYESVHDAILNLFSSALENRVVLSESEWKSAFEISEAVFQLSDPSSFLVNSQIKFSELSYQFLKFFKNQDHGSCPGNIEKDSNFPSAVSQAFDFLSRVFVQSYQGGLGPEGSKITEEFPLGVQESVKVELKFNFSGSFNCSCDFCGEDLSVMKVEVLFRGLGFYGDIFATRVYIAGRLVQNEFVYPTPAVLGVDLNKCFQFSTILSFSFEQGVELKLFSDKNQYFSSSGSLLASDVPGMVQLNYSAFGIFGIMPVCPEGKALNSLFQCSECDSHCKCFCPGDCESCFFNFKFNSITRKCDSCNIGYYLDDCSICSVGFQNVGKSLSCTECAEGFKSSSISELLCDVCQVGFASSGNGKCDLCDEGFKDFGDSRCSVCEEGFEDFGDEKCSVCQTGFQDSNGKKCSVCQEGFQDSDGSKCSACQEGFIDFEGERCSRCAEGFKNSPLGPKCSICEEGFQDVPTGKKCSTCSLGFTDDLESNKKCSKCSTGFTNDEETLKKCSICAEGFTTDPLTESKCSICSESFTDDPISGSRCILCSSNFEDDATGKRCSKCKKGYKTNLSSPSKCSECDVGYQSSSTERVICDSCSPEYGKSSEGECLPCSSNCYCQVSGQCDSCKIGYLPSVTGCSKAFKFISSGDIVSSIIDSSFSSVSITTNKFFDVSFNGQSCEFFFKNFEVLGSGAKCSLRFFNVLFISLGLDFTLNNQTSLNFTSNVLMTKNDWLSSPESVVVSYETEPRVTAIISGPSMVSFACGTDNVWLEYLASGSFGALKHRFAFSWSLSFDSSFVTVGNVEGSDLEKYGFELASSQSGFIVVSLLVSNGFYSSSTSVKVELSLSKSISFKLDSGSGSSFKRGSDISISANIVDICGCQSKLSYSWTLTNSETSSEITGLILTNSKLRISKNFLDYGDFLISLTINCGSSLSGTSSSTISITSSTLVIQTNKGNQQISSESPFSINAGNSYDPDGFSLTFLWSYLEQTSSSSSLTISNSLFSDLESFSLTLEISTKEGKRSTSQSFELTVIKSLLPSLSILGPSSKVGLSSTVVIKASCSEKSSQVSLTWSQVTGPTVVFTSTKTNMWVEPKALIGGSAYSFMLTAAIGTLSVSSTVSFSSNKEPFCTGGLKMKPSAPYYKTTKISFSLEGCADGDNQDLPLGFKLYVMKASKTYMLLLVSSSPTISNLALPVGIAGAKMEVCDSLSDCAMFEQTFTVLPAKRALRESLLEEYLEYKAYFDTLPAVVLILMTGDADDQLIELMWNDFQKFCDNEFKGATLVTEILSTVYLFLNQTYAERRAGDYLQFLKRKISEADHMDLVSFEYVLIIVDKVCELNNRVKIGKLCLDFFESASKHFDRNGQTVKFYSKCAETLHFEGSSEDLEEVKINTVNINNLEEDFERVKINNVEINSLEVKVGKEEIVDVRISVFFNKDSSLLVSSTVFVIKSNDDFDDKENSRNYLKTGTFQLYINNESLIDEVSCSYLNLNSKSCPIKSKDSGLLLILDVNQLISIIPKSDKTSSNVTLNIALYTILSLIFLFLFSVPFLIYIDNKLKLEHEKMNLETVQKSEKSFTNLKEEENQISFKVILNEHLTTSLFTFDLKLCKLAKFSWLVSILISEIFFQSLLLKTTSLEALFVGLLSVAITFPISFLYLKISLHADLPSSKEFLISVLSILLMLLGLEVAYFIGAQEDWLIAFGTGIIAELLVSQPILAFIRRFALSS